MKALEKAGHGFKIAGTKSFMVETLFKKSWEKWTFPILWMLNLKKKATLAGEPKKKKKVVAKACSKKPKKLDLDFHLDFSQRFDDDFWELTSAESLPFYTLHAIILIS